MFAAPSDYSDLLGSELALATPMICPSYVDVCSSEELFDSVVGNLLEDQAELVRFGRPAVPIRRAIRKADIISQRFLGTAKAVTVSPIEGTDAFELVSAAMTMPGERTPTAHDIVMPAGMVRKGAILWGIYNEVTSLWGYADTVADDGYERCSYHRVLRALAHGPASIYDVMVESGSSATGVLSTIESYEADFVIGFNEDGLLERTDVTEIALPPAHNGVPDLSEPESAEYHEESAEEREDAARIDAADDAEPLGPGRRDSANWDDADSVMALSRNDFAAALRLLRVASEAPDEQLAELDLTEDLARMQGLFVHAAPIEVLLDVYEDHLDFQTEENLPVGTVLLDRGQFLDHRSLDALTQASRQRAVVRCNLGAQQSPTGRILGLGFLEEGYSIMMLDEDGRTLHNVPVDSTFSVEITGFDN